MTDVELRRVVYGLKCNEMKSRIREACTHLYETSLPKEGRNTEEISERGHWRKLAN